MSRHSPSSSGPESASLAPPPPIVEASRGRPEATGEPHAQVGPIRSSRDRLIQLDVLRGIAILLVLGRHPAAIPEEARGFVPLADFCFRFGWTGVDLFFVLSGFLIGGLLFLEIKARDHLDVRRFYVRRAFKILPIYVVFLAVAVGLTVTKTGWTLPVSNRGLVKAVVVNLLSLQNYLRTPWMHTWSLSVEEHFYFVLPLILAFLGVRRAGPGAVRSLPVVPAMTAAAIVSCTVTRLLTFRVGHYDVWKNYFPTHLRMDGLFFGVFLAYVYHFKPRIMARVAGHRLALVVAGLALLAPMTVLKLEESWFVPTLGFCWLYLGYGMILLAFVTTPVGEGWAGKVLETRFARALAFVGVYSYAIYLFHMDVTRMAVRRLGEVAHLGSLPFDLGYPVITAAYVAASVGLGYATSRLIEAPSLALRNRLFPPRD